MARMITPEVRLSYPHLFEPQAVQEGDDPKYSVTVIFESEEDIEPFKRAALEEAKEHWGSKLNGASIEYLEGQHAPTPFLVAGNLKIRLPWRDHPDDLANKGYDEIGVAFINARSGQRPGVVSIYKDPDTGKPMRITDESEIYPGVRAKVSLDPYWYDNQSRGVTFGLGNVQKTGDDERIAGPARAEEEFEATESANVELDDLTSEEEQSLGEGGEGGETASSDEGDDLSALLG